MRRNFLPAVVTALALGVAAGAVLAQSKGKIVCWKDKAGKVVGCGDQIPPEYQDAATREIDSKSGLTRKQQREEEARRMADQRRKDQALLGTYLNEVEIDQRRDRELAEVDRLLNQFQGLYKGTTARHSETVGRLAAVEKAGKPADALKDEVARLEAEKAKLERAIATREKEKADITARYAETKRRYAELKGGGSITPAAAKK